jgi:hypothetical protein
MRVSNFDLKVPVVDATTTAQELKLKLIGETFFLLH